LLLVGTAAIAAPGVIMLTRRARKRRQPMEEIQNGCRTEYGPLELRLEATESANGFRAFVEDHRLEHFCISEDAVQSTLDSAKDQLIQKAGEYLASLKDRSRYTANWRCS
jgi:hypothetical protein